MFRQVAISFRANVSAVASKPQFTRQFATYKSTTGLVGLAVDPDGRNTVLRLTEEVFQRIQKIPEDVHYRKNVEKTFQFIHKVASSTEDVKKIEDEIDLGQIEEVIDMIKTELTVIDYYHEHKGWELVAEAQKEADIISKQMENDAFFMSPGAKTL